MNLYMVDLYTVESCMSRVNWKARVCLLQGRVYFDTVLRSNQFDLEARPICADGAMLS